MSSLGDHVRRILQRMCAYSIFSIFLQFVEGTSSQFVTVLTRLYFKIFYTISFKYLYKMYRSYSCKLKLDASVFPVVELFTLKIYKLLG